MSSTLLSGYFGQQLLLEPFRFLAQPHEYKVVALRECPAPDAMLLADTPQKIADYWHQNITSHPMFDPERECPAVLLLNARRRIKGHQLVSLGTLDAVTIHVRDVFRLAIMTSASAIVLAHHHPSGDATPSNADIQITRDLIRAGQVLKIEVVDHIVMGRDSHVSLREQGFFFDSIY
jgi:DNA repair protein RadC